MAANEEMIVGGRQLNDFLQQLAPRVEKNIMRAALRAGANVLKAEAKHEVPVDEGDLLASIRVSVKSKGGTIYASVKAGGKKAPHWHLVEFGTHPHKIKPKKAHALTIGGMVVGEVHHPGARAKPFMRPALDAKSTEAIAAVVAKIRERLTKEGINVPAPEGE